MKGIQFPVVWIIDREQHTRVLQDRIDEFGECCVTDDDDFMELDPDEQVAFIEYAMLSRDYDKFTDTLLATGYQGLDVIMSAQFDLPDEVDSDFEALLRTCESKDWYGETNLRWLMEGFSVRNPSLVKAVTIFDDAGWFFDGLAVQDGVGRDVVLKAWNEFLMSDD